MSQQGGGIANEPPWEDVTKGGRVTRGLSLGAIVEMYGAGDHCGLPRADLPLPSCSRPGFVGWSASGGTETPSPTAGLAGSGPPSPLTVSAVAGNGLE